MIKTNQIAKFMVWLLFLVVSNTHANYSALFRIWYLPKASAVVVQAAQDWKAGKYQKVRDSFKRYAQQCRAKDFCGLGDLTCEHVHEVLKLVDASLKHELDSEVVGFILQGLSTRGIYDAIWYFSKALKKNSNVAFAYKKRADMYSWRAKLLLKRRIRRRNSKRPSDSIRWSGNTYHFWVDYGGAKNAAIKNYTEALQRDPAYVSAYIGRAFYSRTLLKGKDLLKAFSLNRHCIEEVKKKT